MSRRILTPALALALLAGCQEPSKDEPFEPRPEYPAWNTEIAACAGVRPNYSELRFFYLPDDDPHAGLTYGTTIFLRYPDSFSRLIVEHEMLHSLIDDGDHTDPRWVACGVSPAQLQALIEQEVLTDVSMVIKMHHVAR